jgi:hypothetical protein
MKLLLCVFEELSGLKINFHKSELFCTGRQRIMRTFQILRNFNATKKTATLIGK